MFCKTITLDPVNRSQFGASIISIHADVSESLSGWYINATTKQGFQLKLTMDNTWGFRPGHKSTITITIDSDTPLHSIPVDGSSNTDLDALFAASISSQQYIAFDIALDNNNEDNFASPWCSHLAPVSMWSDDDVNAMIANNSASVDRKDIIFQEERLKTMNGWSNDKLTSKTMLKPQRDFNLYPQAYAWPLTFTFENDPMNDILNVSFTTPSWNGFKQYCLFNAFDLTDAGLDFFMAVDDPGEILNYKSFTINETYEQTSFPTKDPSRSPTLQPTNTPSVSPTLNPTVNPTDDPSSNPTVNPTVYPTLDPSISRFRTSLNDDPDNSDKMNGFIAVAVMISVLIVLVSIVLVCILMQLRKGENVSVLPSQIRMASSSVQKERNEPFEIEITANDEPRQLSDHIDEEDSQRQANQLGEGISSPNDPTLERVFATNPYEKEDSFEIIGDDETPMDNRTTVIASEDVIVTVECNESVEDVDQTRF